MVGYKSFQSFCQAWGLDKWGGSDGEGNKLFQFIIPYRFFYWEINMDYIFFVFDFLVQGLLVLGILNGEWKRLTRNK